MKYLNSNKKNENEIVEDIEHIYRTFFNENEHIYYQKLADEITIEIVDPKCITQPESWVPPAPAFTTLK